MTRGDVALMLGVSIRTIDRWIKKEKIPYEKSVINGRIYFDEEEIRQWAEKYMIGRVN